MAMITICINAFIPTSTQNQYFIRNIIQIILSYRIETFCFVHNEECFINNNKRNEIGIKEQHKKMHENNGDTSQTSRKVNLDRKIVRRWSSQKKVEEPSVRNK